MILTGCDVGFFMLSSDSMRSTDGWAQMMRTFCVLGIHSRSPLWSLLGVPFLVMGTCSEGSASGLPLGEQAHVLCSENNNLLGHTSSKSSYFVFYGASMKMHFVSAVLQCKASKCA